MARFLVLLAAFFLLSGVRADSNAVICTTRDLKAFRTGLHHERRRFDLSGTVVRTNAGGTVFVLEDETGRAPLFCDNVTLPHAGDVVHVTGRTRINDKLEAWDFPERIAVTGRCPLPPPKKVRIGDIDEADDDLRSITTEGTVIDVLPDEIDRRYAILTVIDGEHLIPVFTDRHRADEMRRQIGARIRVTGVFHRSDTNSRTFILPYVCTEGIGGIEFLSVPNSDFSDIPDLQSRSGRTPEDLKKLGLCKLTGEVLATWGGSQVMVRTDANFISTVRLIRDLPLPDVGERIVAAGYPETDLFRVNLGNAQWRKTEPHAAVTNEHPQTVVLKDILGEDARQHTGVDPAYYGRLITLFGTVRNISDGSGCQAILNCGGSAVTVDYSSTPDAFSDITVDCIVEVTGRCLLMINNYSQYERFPQITGVAIIPRSRNDIRVREHPSWWTPARLLGVIAGLLALLVVVLIWNRVLNRLVERRGRELFRAEVAKVGSELRIGERTRLAVELHDSLSQNLTGVAMKIKAAERCGATDPTALLHHLEIADKALQSCRDELRNSLWDLRNQALEDADLNRAIRRTLLPHVENVSLAIRFSVRRSLLTDNTAHDILRIIRELAVNAIRHGKATALRIAGSIEGDTLLFSVTDNGHGFDPESCPGVREGHFGLQGVRERLARFAGTLTLESSLGHGTRAVIALHIPTAAKKETNEV